MIPDPVVFSGKLLDKKEELIYNVNREIQDVVVRVVCSNNFHNT